MSILLDRALDQNRPATTGQVAQRIGISQHLVIKIVCRLAKAGLVSSRRGTQGGFRLARSPDEITVGDVVRAIDGAPAGNHELDGTPTFGKARDAFNRVLDGHTLAEIARRQNGAAPRRRSRRGKAST